MEQTPVPNKISPLPIALQSGVATALIIMICHIIVHFAKIEMDKPIQLGLNFSSIFSAIYLAQMILRKLNSVVSFQIAWLTGWFSVLILALFMYGFNFLFYVKLKHQLIPPFSQFIILYNLFGMVGSAIFALILKKK
ncbi:MAG: hypothetical protein IPH74_07075 [Bacteroidetes bacterium]|jgi:hypothetical protein|nr:hypothetical protein [Bacteroidota bacterium]MBK7640477.1 hypothetical protein [Bacteroidota bacterium]MBK9354979.1 hypothetical protein [Bacteroidota bacterium]MBL0288797.1 hypothetical protein [Bacteroidota bacterium]